MAKKVILGTDIARDAFKVKVNENFTELYDKDVALEEQINDLDADVVAHKADDTAHGINLKANKIQENWIIPSTLNGWVLGSTIKYFKSETGIVYIMGLVGGGTIGLNTPVFILPVGYRPLSPILQPIFTTTAAGEFTIGNVAIKTNGEVSAERGSNSGVSFDGVCFRV